MDTVKTAFFSLLLLIDGAIFSLLNSIYKVYIALASARLLTNGMFIDISNRIYAVVGVAMLFVMAYVVIQGIVNPDNFAKSGGEGSQLLRRIGIAVLGLALVPGVFRIAYRGQDVVLNDNIIGKIFLNYDDDSNVIKHGTVKIDDEEIQFDSDGDGKPDSGEINQNDAITSSAGTVAALTVWQAVFYPTNVDDEEQMNDAAEQIKSDLPASNFIRGAKTLTAWGCGIAVVTTIFTLGATLLASAALCGAALATSAADKLAGKQISLAQAYGAASGIGDFSVFIAFADKVTSGDITYRMGVSTLMGIACGYLFLSFAIDMAVRAVKLVYMQLIAPVPLMLQILPKFKDNFQKWLKTVISLFTEVFIRLTFVYIVVYLISHLGAILKGGWLDNANLNLPEMFLAKLILVIGMLMFAKTAPQFVSETLGISSGNMNLGIRKKLAEGGVFSVAASVGGIGANFLSGGITNGIRNRNKYRETQRSGGPLGVLGAGLRFTSGFVTGSLGYAARSARRTIIDSKSASNLHEVGARIADSYNRGKQEAATRKQRADDREKELQAYGYDKEQEEKNLKGARHKIVYRAGSAVRHMGAETAYRANQIKKGFIDFASIPENYSKVEVEFKVKSAVEEMGKTLQDAAIIENENYKRAVQNRNYLDSDEARQKTAIELANAEGKGKDVESADGLRNYMATNSERINDRMFAKKQEADAKVKAAKKNAVNEELEKEALMGGGKVTEAAHNFIQKNMELFRTHGNDIFNIGENGAPMKLHEYMQKQFGANYEVGVDPKIMATAFAKDERNIEIVAEGDEHGIIKYRRREGAAEGEPLEAIFEDKDGKTWKVDLDASGEKKLHLESTSGDKTTKELTVKSVVGRTVLGHTEVGISGDHKLQSGSIAAMAEKLGGTLEYRIADSADMATASSERITVKTNEAGQKTARVVTGSVPTKVSSITTITSDSGVLTAEAPSLTIDAIVGDSKVPVTLTRVERDGGAIEVQASVAGQQISLDGRSSVSLTELVPTSSPKAIIASLSSVDKSSDGVQRVTLGDDKQFEVVVQGQAVTACHRVVQSGTTIAAAITGTSYAGDAVIDIVGTADSLKPNESLEFRTADENIRYEVSKDASGSKVYRKIDTSKAGADRITPITEGEASEAFADRKEVDVASLDRLHKSAKEARIKILKGGLSGDVLVSGEADGEKTFEIIDGADDTGEVEFESILKVIGEGQTISVNIPGIGKVSITRTSKGFTVVREGYPEKEYNNLNSLLKDYQININPSDIVDAIKEVPGTTRTITFKSEDGPVPITITGLDATGLAEHGSGKVLVGGEEILKSLTAAITEAAKGHNRGEGSLRFTDGGTLRIEPSISGSGSPRLSYNSPNNDSWVTLTMEDLEKILSGTPVPGLEAIAAELKAQLGADSTATIGIDYMTRTEDKTKSPVEEIKDIMEKWQDRIASDPEFIRAYRTGNRTGNNSGSNGK